MAHRALVAYRRPPDTYAVHYAHWGDRLGDAIGPAAPFGGRPDDATTPDADALAKRLGVASSDGYEPAPTRVDPRPLVRRADPEGVLAAVDPSVESLVVVDLDYTTTTYLVVSLSFPAAGRRTDHDAVCFVRPDDDVERFRNWLVETRSELGGAVAAGALAPSDARRSLLGGLLDRGAVFRGDDASFLRSD